MKSKILIPAVIIIVFAIGAYFIFGTESELSENIITNPRKGKFLVTVTTTGELQAKSSKEILGPVGARQLGIAQMKISRLVPEGTIVKQGEFVAELDKSEILLKVKEIELSLQKFESQYQQARLDSTLTLSGARDELENLKFTLEEKKLEKEQSIYEPPAAIRKVEIDYERTQRSFNQSIKNYETKVKQSIAKLTIAGADLSKEKQQLDRLMQTFQEFTITAPADGMVIYAKEWGGRRKVVGSTISFWDPVVATLPDLTTMESITYVNEIDIQKIKSGQKVNIKLDAMPDKKLTGEVTSVANIGEQRMNSDSKVFEVKVIINEKDSTLLPSMTTSIEFIIESKEMAISLPLESIHSNDSKHFVYKLQDGKIVKTEVKLGLINDNEAEILKGISENDKVLLSMPMEDKNMKIVYLKKQK